MGHADRTHDTLATGLRTAQPEGKEGLGGQVLSHETAVGIQAPCRRLALRYLSQGLQSLGLPSSSPPLTAGRPQRGTAAAAAARYPVCIRAWRKRGLSLASDCWGQREAIHHHQAGEREGSPIRPLARARHREMRAEALF